MKLYSNRLRTLSCFTIGDTVITPRDWYSYTFVQWPRPSATVTAFRFADRHSRRSYEGFALRSLACTLLNQPNYMCFNLAKLRTRNYTKSSLQRKTNLFELLFDVPRSFASQHACAFHANMNDLSLARLRQLQCAAEYSVGADKPEIVPITFLCVLLCFLKYFLWRSLAMKCRDLSWGCHHGEDSFSTLW